MSKNEDPKTPPEPAFHVLSDAELARRSRQVTLAGLAVVFLVSAVTVLLMFQKNVSPAKAGPLHVVTTVTHGGKSGAPTPDSPGEGAETPGTEVTPTPPKPVDKPVYVVPPGKGLVRNGKTVYEW